MSHEKENLQEISQRSFSSQCPTNRRHRHVFHGPSLAWLSSAQVRPRAGARRPGGDPDLQPYRPLEGFLQQGRKPGQVQREVGW